MTSDPWTLYWQSGHARSCIATQSKDDVQAVAAYWRSFAESLPVKSTVLDLATGNGTVPAMLLKSNVELVITGVDRASIDPHRDLSNTNELGSADFLGEVDICKLPFAKGSFGAVTSQFGIEYAPLDAALAEAARVLAPGGQLAFLIHHRDSGVVGPAPARREEMDALLVDNGVVAMLENYVAGKATAAELESTGERHLSSDVERTAQVTGQVFTGVNQVIELLKVGNSDRALQLCNILRLRLTADRDRLKMLEDAALDADEIRTVVEQLSECGVQCDELAVLRAQNDDSLIIGWTVSGSRVN